MTDSHCHLDRCPDPRIAADPELSALVTVGTDLHRNRLALELSAELPNVWAAVGIHPNNASDADDPAIRDETEALARDERVVAIGETGFDTHWQDETLDSQRRAFFWHAEVAARVNKPLILHVRDAQGGDDASRAAIEALREAGYRKGILHCFNGHSDLLEVGLELGWMVSFAGNLTYPSAARLQESARMVPAERLLVETDSPFLAPVPQRGKGNLPANVRLVATYLAELRGLEHQAVERLTDENARRVYSLPA